MSYLGKKDLSMIFNAVGRVWPRTERYKTIQALLREPDEGPGGKWWYPCSACNERFRQTEVDIDHIDPVVPLNKRRNEMNLLDYVERKFLCPIPNFQVLCKPCHRKKTNREKRIRMAHLKNQDLIKSEPLTGSDLTEPSKLES